MFDSIYKLIRERVGSPLYGTLIISWLIINWKIPYLTLFVSEKTIAPATKIDFIITNYWHWWPGLLLPVISTIILLTLMQFLDREVFRLYQKFKTDKRKIREAFDKDKMLTKEESERMIIERIEMAENHRKETDLSDKKLGILNAANTRLQELLEKEKNELKICYAEYGVPENMKEVTEDIKKDLAKKGSTTFEITNNAFTVGDPAAGEIKNFFIVYSLRGEFKFLRAREYDLISISSDVQVDDKAGAAKRIAHYESLKKDTSKP